MRNFKIVKSLLIGLCVLSLVGCGMEDGSVKDIENNPIAENENTSSSNEQVNDNDANVLLESSTALGSVVDFTDTGCIVTLVEEMDDGKTAVVAAPGSDSSDTNITVNYDSGCIFQIAIINPLTGEADISDATVSDIKKQTSLIIYGDYQDTDTLNATKVIIARYEG